MRVTTRTCKRNASYIYIYIYIYIKLPVVITPMCISLNLGRIWPNEVYVDKVYDHTKPSKVVYMLSMHAYIKYVIILIIYTTVVAFY